MASGIIKALFGIGKGKMKTVPWTQMTPELHNQLSSQLGKLMFVIKSQNLKLTKFQEDYLRNQLKHMDEFEKRVLTKTETPKPKGEVRPFMGAGKLRVQQDVDGIIKNLKSMEPMDAMKEANLIIGRKGKYKHLSGDEAQRILKDTDDHIFQRDIKYDEFGDPVDIDPEDMASGGIARAGMFAGGPVLAKGAKWFIGSLKKNLTDLKAGHPRFKDIPAEEQKMLMEGYETFIKQLEAGGEVPKEALEAISKNPQYYKTKKVVRSQDPDLAEVEELIDEKVFGHVRQELKDLETVGKKGHASGGIAGQLHLYDGGRAGFKKGGFDPSKRKFLKGTGATLGVLSMLPFVGKFFKPAAKAVGKFKGTPNLVVDITKTPNMPDWYIPLIKKVLNQGDDVTSKAATAERQTVHRDILPDGDEVTVTQNIDNQTISVNVVNPKDNYFSASGAGEQPYTIQYSKGKVIEDGKYKGQKEADTLEVDEPVLHRSGPEPDDVEIDADVVNYNPKAEVHDTSVLESYATGKKVQSRGSGEVYDPWEGYSPDLKADKAEGGRVSLSKGGLAKILGV